MGGHLVLVVQNLQKYEPVVQTLAADGYCALCFRSVEEAGSYLREPDCPAAVVVLQISMRRQSDFTSLTELGKQRPELQMLLVSPEPNPLLEILMTSNEGIRVVPDDLDNPTTIQILLKTLRVAEALASEAALEAVSLQGGLNLPYSEEFLRRVGLAEVPVLLSGETGVGKEVMARRLRSYSRRADRPFLKLNCAALPPELAESELFGVVRGAFTGATVDRPGRFETAQGGTILLDEIGDMDLRLQTKLLHVLQDGEIQPLGSNRTIKVDVRVMAATHRDLLKGIQDGTFREDLYYRLNVIKIVIPPLRERTEEILPLAQSLLSKHLPAGHPIPVMNGDLKRFLQTYRWPGNVRELENVMRRFLVYQDSALLIQELLDADIDSRPGISIAAHAISPPPNQPQGLTSSTSSSRTEGAGKAFNVTKSEKLKPIEDRERSDRLDQLAEASRRAETEVLLEALEANRWNRRQAAASLQIEYKAFLYKLQKYGIVESKGKRREISA